MVDVAELRELFRELNDLYFHGDLPEPEVIGWMNSVNRAGCFKYWRNSPRMEIRVSRHRHVTYGWSATRDTMLHELVHLYQYVNTGKTRDGDPEFQRLLATVGAHRHCPSLPPTTEHFRYVYQCQTCGHKFGAQRLYRRPHRHRGCGGRLRLIEYREGR